MFLTDKVGLANSVGSDQTAPKGCKNVAVFTTTFLRPATGLFAKTFLSKYMYLEFLKYLKFDPVQSAVWNSVKIFPVEQHLSSCSDIFNVLKYWDM